MKTVCSFRVASTLLVSLFLGSIAFAKEAPESGSPRLPFAFVENQGQADGAVRYIGNGPEFKAWFEDSGVILQRGAIAVRIGFVRGGASPRIQAADPTGAHANYLRGSDPSQWRTNLPLYGAIHYDGVWPGIGITYKADGAGVKAEYLVAPGADAENIILNFDREASTAAEGTLRLHGMGGDFIEDKPVLFQIVDGRKKTVEGGFRKLSDGSIGFRTGTYDRSEPLVIDPSILLSGYFGGTTQDAITAIGFDIYNNIVAAGWTSSKDLPAGAPSNPITGRGGCIRSELCPERRRIVLVHLSRWIRRRPRIRTGDRRFAQHICHGMDLIDKFSDS